MKAEDSDMSEKAILEEWNKFRKITTDKISKNKWIVCSNCNGNGFIEHKKCPICKGSGVRRVGE